MAEESTDLLVTPEITNPNEGNLGRNSMGKANSANNGEKVVPHYRRASTGSCHDFCKYGRRHEVEAKARHPMWKRNEKPALNNQSPTIVILPERKKTSVVKPNTSPISKPRLSDVPEIFKREISTKSPDGQNVNASSDSQNLVKREVQSGMKKTSAVKLRPLSNSKTGVSQSPKFERREVSSSSEKVDVFSRKASTNSKSPKFKRQEVLSSSEKVNVPSRKASAKSNESNAPVKHVTLLKLKSPINKPMSLPDHAVSSNRSRHSDINTRNKMGSPKVAVEKALASERLSLAPPRASLSPKPSIRRVASFTSRTHRSLKVVSPLKNQGKVKNAKTEKSKNVLRQANNDSVHEKTLYAVKMEAENKSFESDQNESCAIEPSPLPSSLLSKSLPTSPSSSLSNEEDQEQSEHTETEAEDDWVSEYECDESMSVEGEEDLDGDQGKSRKGRVVHSDDKNSLAVKLHFRRGKIVDIQPENSSPRRLKFRRGRGLGENQNLKADSRRRFKKGGVDGETNGSKPGPEIVSLRHQDVQGKKDSQVLFNNVIEQTASKLVETRKSKVKALVGAFETVISLQDSKPSTNIVS